MPICFCLWPLKMDVSKLYWKPCGLTLFNLHVSISDASIAQYAALALWHTKSGFWRCKAIGRMVLSTASLPVSMRLSPWNKFSPTQYSAVYLRASPVCDLAETYARAKFSRGLKPVILAADSSCRKARRSLADRPGICLSIR